MKDLRGRDFEVQVDFLEEHGLPGEREIRITKVLYVAERRTGVPDVALLAIERSSAWPRPIPLFNGVPAKGSWIGVIGYPLPDDRVPPENRDAEERYFSNIYGVKRLSPGTIRAPSDGGALAWLIAHDATTLGGNSGSAIVDLATGAAVGLHFAGRPQIENLGVGAVELARLVKDVGAPATLVSVDRGDFDEPNIADVDTEAPRDVLLAELATRQGYDATFIKPGNSAFTIPLPKITATAPGQIATPDHGGAELKYLHFSVKMNAERRLCYFSAVNIDGNKTFSIKGRRPGWRFDPRFETPSSAQIKNECYGLEQDGKFSRGHMTRREDPNWGDERETAVEANDDTFFVTNACPQFQPFNAGIWLSLEDYALENADGDDMRIAVFTGPIFEASDPEYFGIKVPVRFWKIIAFKHDETKQLTATGYIMSQEDVLPTEEEFVFGQFRSSQVPITRIERLTGLDFHKLRDCDPLATEEETMVERPLRGASDLVFRRPGGP
jgi:endonuclease G